MTVVAKSLPEHIDEEMLGQRVVFIMRSGRAFGGIVDHVTREYVYLTDAGQVLDVDPPVEGRFATWRPLLTHWCLPIDKIVGCALARDPS